MYLVTPFIAINSGASNITVLAAKYDDDTAAKAAGGLVGQYYVVADTSLAFVPGTLRQIQ